MTTRHIIKAILQRYPTAQAIYLFGSYGTPEEWADSDVDIALLLPHPDAKQAGSLALTDLHLALQDMLQRSVDLINLRRVSTVLQKEVVGANRRIYCRDIGVCDEFEMLTLSFYQKLNAEREEILEQFHQTGRAYDV